MLRILHVLVLGTLVLAAADVYKIKFESTLQAESVARLRNDIRHERDAIAALRAEWTKLDTPERIEQLAGRHLALRPVDVTQFDTLDGLPEKPPPLVPPGTTDPIGAVIENESDSAVLTGSIGR